MSDSRQTPDVPAFQLTSQDQKTWSHTSAATRTATPEHVDKMTMQHGWFREQLMIIESALWGRWPYWLAMVLNRRLGPLPEWSIPQLPLGPISGSRQLTHDNASIREMVGTADSAKRQTFKVFGQALRPGGYIGDLFRWWLYAFGSPTVTERPALSDEAKVAMYSGLNLGWLLGHPGDWGAELCLEFLGTDRRAGWFPTPMSIVELMVRLNFTDSEADTRAVSVHDPCVGTGVMLLSASNFSLNLSGQDINQTMCLACEFNGWLFMPWLVYGKQAVRELRNEVQAVSEDSLQAPSPDIPPLGAPFSPGVSVTLKPDEEQGSLFGN